MVKREGGQQLGHHVEMQGRALNIGHQGET